MQRRFLQKINFEINFNNSENILDIVTKITGIVAGIKQNSLTALQIPYLFFKYRVTENAFFLFQFADGPLN